MVNSASVSYNQALEIKNLSRSFGSKQALHEVSL